MNATKTSLCITGANSFIGETLSSYFETKKDEYNIFTVDTKKELSENCFNNVDVVIHVAGIAHIKETPHNKNTYHRVNCELAVDIAKKAKEQGVKQFIFFSSMSVYGKITGNITKETPPKPNTYYGQSKWDAEQALAPLSSPTFKILYLRPPMIYGKGCKGNYPLLRKLILKLPFFFYVKNARSLLYTETLCLNIERLIRDKAEGLCFPHNKQDTNTTDLAIAIALAHNKKLPIIKGFAWLFSFVSNQVSIVGKAFGTLTYDKNMLPYSDLPEKTLIQSIKETEQM